MIQTTDLKYKRLIEKELSSLELSLRTQVYPDFLGLDEKLIYPFTSGSKRVRGSLLILCAHLAHYELYPGTVPDFERVEKMIAVASAVEITHNASLIHDDIFDNAMLRRNKPTINNLYGNHTALVLGDYLCAHAFDIIGKTNDVTVLNILTHAVKRLSLGEAEELLMRERSPENLDEALTIYFRICENKTASLMAASCELGAHIAGAGKKMGAAYYNFGLMLGKSFQIIDDILDIVGNKTVVGKDTQADLVNNSLTLPLIYLFRDSGYDFSKMRDILKSPENTATLLDQINNSDIIESCFEQAKNLAVNASRFLHTFTESEYRDSLDEIINFIIKRNA